MDFGDYCLIEQKRYGADNEMYVHKVIGALRSNTWVEVPVDAAKNGRQEMHGEMADVVRCICCGVDETEVRKYRVRDVQALQTKGADKMQYPDGLLTRDTPSTREPVNEGRCYFCGVWPNEPHLGTCRYSLSDKDCAHEID